MRRKVRQSQSCKIVLPILFNTIFTHSNSNCRFTAYCVMWRKCSNTMISSWRICTHGLPGISMRRTRRLRLALRCSKQLSSEHNQLSLWCVSNQYFFCFCLPPTAIHLCWTNVVWRTKLKSCCWRTSNVVWCRKLSRFAPTLRLAATLMKVLMRSRTRCEPVSHWAPKRHPSKSIWSLHHVTWWPRPHWTGRKALPYYRRHWRASRKPSRSSTAFSPSSMRYDQLIYVNIW